MGHRMLTTTKVKTPQTSLQDSLETVLDFSRGQPMVFETQIMPDKIQTTVPPMAGM
jgi:hypothetical protein